MKKAFSILFVAALVLALGVTSALAAAEPAGARFADADDDGVCDTCGAVDANGDGICDTCPNGGLRPQDGTGRRMGRGIGGCGAEFTDTDGDGVCDNFPNGGLRPRDGTGLRYGRNN